MEPDIHYSSKVYILHWNVYIVSITGTLELQIIM